MTPKKFPNDPRFYLLSAGDNPRTSDAYVTRVAWPDIDAEIDVENKERLEAWSLIPADDHVAPPAPKQKLSSLFMCWQLTPEELAHVQATGEIWFGVMTSRSGTQPPVIAMAGTPEENGFVQLTKAGDIYNQ